MILILTPNIDPDSHSYQQLMAHLARLQDIRLRVHREQGTEQTLTEIYLIGNTSSISTEDMKSLPGVERVVRVSEENRVVGRHRDDHRDRKSTRLNSSHGYISYAVFCLKKKKTNTTLNGRIQHS